MSLKTKYIIKEISKKDAQDIIVREHYLHRKAPCSYCYGLIEVATGNIVGVVMYGVPASRALQVGVCGKENAHLVGELTRLWIDDSVQKNGESFLIGNTIRMQGFKILVSYAECRANHVGYVYQATNWLYTGLSAKRNDYLIDGVESGKHGRHLLDSYGGIKKAREILGDRLVSVERPRKHRYVYFNCGKKDRKHLIKALKYKIEKYPKGEVVKPSEVTTTIQSDMQLAWNI